MSTEPVLKAVTTSADEVAAELNSIFKLQRDDFLNSEPETAAERIKHLRNLRAMLVDNKDAITEAINKDYGNRSSHETLFAEYIAVLDDIDHTIKHVKKWMKPQKRKIDITMYFGAKNRVIPQPLGVVGVIVPWNFPINQVMTQLAAVFSAGNRAMVKMSENSMALCKCLQDVVGKYFAPEKLQFVMETGCVGVEFSKIPFDHLLFTGSSATGRKVMAAAANNLTPVTLELGGKCPAIIDPEYDLKKAVDRILFVKQFNAGQICTTVDYAFVHRTQRDEFIAKCKEWAAKHIPDINAKDFTSIIDQTAFERVTNTIKEAQAEGATVINLCGQEANPENRKVPLTLILDTKENMTIRNRETFGPVLMVMEYDKPEDVLEYLKDKDRPLALYPFSRNKSLQDFYIRRIMSGGVTVNDALYHVGQSDMPFGGVGASGMGHYHGYEGFITFSKLRPIMYQANTTSGKFLMPPYSTGMADKILNFMAKLKS